MIWQAEDAGALRGSRGWLPGTVLVVLAAAAFVACTGEIEGEHSTVTISEARARFTTTDLGAVYFDIHITGVGDVLTGASSEIADGAQLHQVVTEGSTSRMRRVEGGIPIEPSVPVRLEPGGYHVMLLGVDEIPEVNETFEVVLEFERAGRLPVPVRVEAFGSDGRGTGGGRDREGAHE